MEDTLKELLAAAEALVEDADLVDDEMYGYVVSPRLVDNLQNALERMRQNG
jgi:hypothetical protein